MRILLPTLYDTVGGSTKVLLAAAGALATKHEVIVRAPLAEASSRHGLAFPASVSGAAAKAAAAPILARAAFQEASWLSGRRPDLIHVHDEIALYVYGLLAKRFRIPVIWHVHMREGSGLTRYVREALASAKIFISEFSVQPEQTLPHTVIRNPVQIPVLRAIPRDDGALRLAVVGSLSRRKNQALAIDTARVLRDSGLSVRLTLYGEQVEAAYAGALRRLIDETGLGDMVRLAGHKQVGEALAETDVLLAPSRYENQPLAVLEALGAGIPVVASDIPAHREISSILNTKALAVAGPGPEVFASRVRSIRADPGSPDLIARVFGQQRFARELLAFVDQLDRKR
ncbi:hypothetical protein SLNSH_17425 [Alsobacter soli]|uniref:Glycosyltransferase family 1 protein n=1 Tax=Alsobacter soli TaxID=2109933 RepID=A0A2T1HPZ2_9HYPH|nr:glycosyltransferase family 4 protein [Alsobacter soli]PSC03725.1 hypothetical protein SLNSH_17425 [Alsobacter soli]